MILDGISLATRGLRNGEDNCPQQIAQITFAFYLVEEALEDKLADPGRPRGWEPWDISYYRWKYGRQEKAREPEPERPNVMSQLLDQQELELLEARNAEVERDIIELRAYIRGVEEGVAADLVAQEVAVERQEAVLERLREDVVFAREALLVALEARRRHQNQLAAIEAVIRFYY